jgi:Gpi18-like mannosyltransferase
MEANVIQAQELIVTISSANETADNSNVQICFPDSICWSSFHEYNTVLMNDITRSNSVNWILYPLAVSVTFNLVSCLVSICTVERVELPFQPKAMSSCVLIAIHERKKFFDHECFTTNFVEQ